MYVCSLLTPFTSFLTCTFVPSSVDTILVSTDAEAEPSFIFVFVLCPPLEALTDVFVMTLLEFSIRTVASAAVGMDDTRSSMAIRFVSERDIILLRPPRAG